MLLNLLVKHNIKYDIFEHPPLNTVQESKKMRGDIDGAHTKNLFLKNKKNNFFLFSCLESTVIDLKKLNKILNLGNISFAKDDYLRSMLEVEPGAVTPFGLLNNLQNNIKFFLDQKIIEYNKVSFHPLVNTSTVALQTQEFLYFMKTNNKLVNIFNFDNYTLINE